MSDRDIPSVPVTTLAGLTSLSDLLSELPVSDSLSNVTSLNKSLLFHTLVANESNNLLSVRDDNLVRQLVHAIEQTNSDNIELKSQYAIQQRTNISTYPELLQGIYTYRPTVFNTPQNHRQQNHQSQLLHNIQKQQQQQQTQQQRHSGVNVLQSLSLEQQPQTQQQHHKSPLQNNVTLQQFKSCTQASAATSIIDSNKLPQQPQILQQVIISPTQQSSLLTRSTTYQHQQSPLQNVSVDTPTRRTRRQGTTGTLTTEHQHQHSQISSPQQQPQQLEVKSPSQQHLGMSPPLQQQKQPTQVINSLQQHVHVQISPAKQHQQQQQLQTQLQHQQTLQAQPQSQQVVSCQKKNKIAQHTSVIQQQISPVLQQRQQIHTTNQTHSSQQQQTVIISTPPTIHQKQSVIINKQQQHSLTQTKVAQLSTPSQIVQKISQPTQQEAQPQQQKLLSPSLTTIVQSETPLQIVQQTVQQEQRQLLHLPQQSPTQQEPQKVQQVIQGQFQNVLNLQRQQFAQHKSQQLLLQNQQQSKISDGNSIQAHTSIALPSEHVSVVQQKPAIDDQQQLRILKNDTTETTKSATNSVAPTKVESQRTHSDITASAGKNARSGANPRVCINRLKTEDARLMQQSIKEFVKKSPEIAKKMGIPVPGQPNTAASTTTSLKNTKPTALAMGIPNSENTENSKKKVDTHNHSSVSATTNVADTFTMMKADEKRSATKRKLAIKMDDLPPEQIFSKPKVRRVERIVSTPAPKCSKEEVMRSQTYQQFMRNMEQIIEQLDDTETPNFDSEDVDENIECISSKMLNTMSNDVAKLKAKMVLDSIPKNKLTLLINYAMRNIYLAKNYSAGPDDEDEIIGDEVMEKILNAVEACLLICNIYSTAKDLKFLQEDNISLIIKFVQFQFRETIYPSYDPVYTVKSMKKDQRKKKAQQSHNRNLQLLYSKSVELMKVFVTLFDKCIFVDTIVLPLSTLAIEPFFVDNIDTLQFVCLELVTTIFRKEKYDKMRSSILGDILSSIDRLPSSKKNLRPFKLTNNGGNIQMVTALVLQLIQCATILPESIYEPIVVGSNKVKSKHIIEIDEEGAKIDKHNTDVLVLKKYDVAVSIGGNFLTTFLNKCKTRLNETDFRPLFENFIHDLLATVNKPEWPASELLLSLLGTMLVKYVSDKTIEQSIRLVSLDYLGIVAARLRRDTVESRCKVNIIDSMIKCIKMEQEKEGDLQFVNRKIQLDPEEERTEFLQKILLDFLAVNAQEEDLIWDYARHFYLAQWYRDIIYQRRRIAEGEKGYASRKKKAPRKTRKKGESSGSSSDSDSNVASCEDDADCKKNSNGKSNRTNNDRSGTTDQELNLEIFHFLEERKRYLLSKIKPYSSLTDLNHTSQHIKTYIDYNNAHLIAQYLATKRPFSQSFDIYLKKIILVVNEPSIAVRTRAMKCLANIVEVDPLVLKRKDMQMGVNQKFLDAAISVREAAVDLVGKFVLSNEELIDQYYDMLSTRILDTGVSVRKRVIKILRDICIDYPDFEKIPEICVKMIRRVNDEEGIQKLVTEVFMKMWFTPCRDNDRHGIQRKINQIIDVVNTAHDTGTTWLEGLLTSIFAPKENNHKPDGSMQESVKKNTEPAPEIVTACQQLADGLVERLIELEDTDNSRMLGCITTLHLLAKVRPQLLVRHAITIEPYLNIKCHSAIAPKFICAVAEMLEQVVPLVINPSESFLASLEEHLMLLVVSLNQAVVTSCVSCLGALVNKITKNYKLIRDCFQKFYRIIEHSRNQVEQNIHTIESIYTPIFRRSLFTIGILMRYFDFKSPKVIGENSLPPTICDEAFECLMFFNQCSNYEIRKQALIALGSYCVMNDDYLTRTELKHFYCDLLRSETIEPCIKIICMRNIWIYLTESEIYMHNKEKDWDKQQKTEDLKEMNDVSSGMASRIIQLYLQDILDCFLHRDESVRLWAVKVVQIVLRQGLVHPVRMVPYLITLSTDSRQETAHRADALLKEIDKTYSGFVNMKVQFGLQLCFKLQEMLQCNKGKNNNVVRGYVKRELDVMPSSLNDFLYTLLRTTKPQRRALVQTVTKQFDDQKTTLRQMLYIADNLAYFPYVVQDEPLYLIHQIDLMISMAGTNLLATFKECLKPSGSNEVLEDDDDEEDPEALFKRLPDNTTEIEKCITSAQACMLLLILKQHLKDMYGLTDGKISRYSPSETQKIYEKAVTRKTVPDFNPKSIISVIKNSKTINEIASRQSNTLGEQKSLLNDEEKMDLIVKYLDFKQLMLKLDPDDVDSLDEERDKSKLNNTTISDTPTTSAVNTTNQTLDDSSCGVGASGNSTCVDTPNINNSSSNHAVSTPVQNKDIPVTPTSRSVSRGTKTTARKQATRSKRKKRKLVSSDEEEDDYSDAD